MMAEVTLWEATYSAGKYTNHSLHPCSTYVSMFAGGVVSDFHRLKTDWLFHPEFSRVGGAGVLDDLSLLVLQHLRFSHRHPLHVYELVAIFVCRTHTQRDCVLSSGVQASHGHHHRRE